MLQVKRSTLVAISVISTAGFVATSSLLAVQARSALSMPGAEGVSALVAAIALCGVSVSLVLQHREHRTNLLYTMNQRQFELVKYTLENPALTYSWGEEGDDPNYRLRVFCNLICTHWLTLWRIRDIDELMLRASAERFFRGSVARAFWTDVGATWIRQPSRRDAYFMAVMTEELLKATMSGPAAVVPPAVPPVLPVRRGFYRSSRQFDSGMRLSESSGRGARRQAGWSSRT
ncbi:hypothetical protein Cme02nite_54830 [Catellatospora methionotrophica]|uniref:Uncharacterized protein n=1 Tax=Catellatospora methionotrophica TaxID=121620 RepID=A0A8J3LL44_9ACTN|nr:DUF6082 family protein [Catellatospora methionotrophica]GIG17151.1 hypothetical protein Cme02nite_54830 [Catellatospora methionotrophica]